MPFECILMGFYELDTHLLIGPLCGMQKADDYWTPRDQIALKKNKCGCVMEMGFAGDEVRHALMLLERDRHGCWCRAGCNALMRSWGVLETF